MKLYKIFDNLAWWFRFQATYLEMKYHLKQVLNGKEKSYNKITYHHERCIGKSVALARLSTKYDIPIAVPTHTWSTELTKNIPKRLPKYFKKKLPETIVINEKIRGKKYKVLLMEECLSWDQINVVNHLCNGAVVGYIKY